MEAAVLIKWETLEGFITLDFLVFWSCLGDFTISPYLFYLYFIGTLVRWLGFSRKSERDRFNFANKACWL
jgi:hypothetical protein